MRVFEVRLLALEHKLAGKGFGLGVPGFSLLTICTGKVGSLWYTCGICLSEKKGSAHIPKTLESLLVDPEILNSLRDAQYDRQILPAVGVRHASVDQNIPAPLGT